MRSKPRGVLSLKQPPGRDHRLIRFYREPILFPNERDRMRVRESTLLRLRDELFRNGIAAPAVQRLAGHAELPTTQRYEDMVATDLKAAIATFSIAGGTKAEGV
jgi:hypothetical protein